MKVDYSELDKLESYLQDPRKLEQLSQSYTYQRYDDEDSDVHQIRVYMLSKDTRGFAHIDGEVFDAVISKITYGNKHGLLEISGKIIRGSGLFLDDVMGDLTADKIWDILVNWDRRRA